MVESTALWLVDNWVSWKVLPKVLLRAVMMVNTTVDSKVFQ